MSDDITPQQVSAPLHKTGHDAQKSIGPTIPANPLMTHVHAAEDHQGENSIATVHVTSEAVATFEMTPPHAVRVNTAAYEKSRKYLIDTQDKPCVVCGVRKSTLLDATQNRFGTTELETHHFPIERSLLHACDPDKIHHAFPEVIDKETLEAFVDSPRNLIVLCDIHHRSLEQGIHHLLVQDYAILPYLLDNYQIVATAQDKAVVQQKDQAIEDTENQRSNTNL